MSSIVVIDPSEDVIQVVGAGGPPGPQGPTGPTGPQGPPGTASTANGFYRWTTNLASVNSGQVGVNAASWAAVTEIHLASLTDSGTDISVVLDRLKAGDGIYLQVQDDSSQWARYTISGPPIETAPGVWISCPVAYVGSGVPALPGVNESMTVSLLIEGADLDLDYQGDWQAGSWREGDIAIHNGIAYLCVRDTTSPPVAWPGAA